MAIGPYRVGQIAADLVSPFGDKGMPGGGSLLRLPGNGGYGGTLELPLGPVQVSAAAVLATSGGQPSFLAILGAQFIPRSSFLAKVSTPRRNQPQGRLRIQLRHAMTSLNTVEEQVPLVRAGPKPRRVTGG